MEILVMYLQKPFSNEYTQSTKVPEFFVTFSLVTSPHSQSAVAPTDIILPTVTHLTTNFGTSSGYQECTQTPKCPLTKIGNFRNSLARFMSSN